MLVWRLFNVNSGLEYIISTQNVEGAKHEFLRYTFIWYDLDFSPNRNPLCQLPDCHLSTSIMKISIQKWLYIKRIIYAICDILSSGFTKQWFLCTINILWPWPSTDRITPLSPLLYCLETDLGSLLHAKHFKLIHILRFVHVDILFNSDRRISTGFKCKHSLPNIDFVFLYPFLCFFESLLGCSACWKLYL